MPSWRYLLEYLGDAAYADRYGPPTLRYLSLVIGTTVMTSSKVGGL